MPMYLKCILITVDHIFSLQQQLEQQLEELQKIEFILAPEKQTLLTQVRSTIVDVVVVVVDKSTNTLLSIKSQTFCQTSCEALWLFYVHCQVPGYKNKSKNVTSLGILHAVRVKAVL